MYAGRTSGSLIGRADGMKAWVPIIKGPKVIERKMFLFEILSNLNTIVEEKG